MEKSNKSVKLVGFWVSPFVHRVRWALKLKGVEYEYIEEDIFNRSPLLSELNPVYQKVPVFIHDENSLPESFIILEYIDQIWKHNPLLPQDPYERAQVRFWSKVAEEKLLDSAWCAVGSEGEKQERAVEVAIDALGKLEKLLKLLGNNFFGGDKIGYLDLIMGFVSYMLPVWEEVASVKIFDHLKFPCIAAWKDNFINHQVIKGEYLPSTAEMVSYFHWRRREIMAVLASN